MRDLDTYASQPSVYVNDDGSILIAYEQTELVFGNFIRLRYYKSFEDLFANKYQNQIDLRQSLSPIAIGGKPSFESVNIQNHDLDSSEIKIRFHHFLGLVDQQAIGTLTGFKYWDTLPLTLINRNLKDMGYIGNLGSRSKFSMNGTEYNLIEAQITPGDWSTWRVVLTRGVSMPLR